MTKNKGSWNPPPPIQRRVNSLKMFDSKHLKFSICWLVILRLFNFSPSNSKILRIQGGHHKGEKKCLKMLPFDLFFFRASPTGSIYHKSEVICHTPHCISHKPHLITMIYFTTNIWVKPVTDSSDIAQSCSSFTCHEFLPGGMNSCRKPVSLHAKNVRKILNSNAIIH